MQLAANSRAGIKRTWPLRKRFRLINFQSGFGVFWRGIRGAHFRFHFGEFVEMNISENCSQHHLRVAIPKRYIDSRSNGIFAANAVRDAHGIAA